MVPLPMDAILKEWVDQQSPLPQCRDGRDRRNTATEKRQKSSCDVEESRRYLIPHPKHGMDARYPWRCINRRVS